MKYLPMMLIFAVFGLLLALAGCRNSNNANVPKTSQSSTLSNSVQTPATKDTSAVSTEVSKTTGTATTEKGASPDAKDAGTMKGVCPVMGGSKTSAEKPTQVCPATSEQTGAVAGKTTTKTSTPDTGVCPVMSKTGKAEGAKSGNTCPVYKGDSSAPSTK